MSTQSRVCVVIVNYNTPYTLMRQCMVSLGYTAWPDLEVLLVDNASTDDSLERVRTEFPSMRVLQTGRNLGYAGGNNVGLRYGLERGYTYAVLLNPDTGIVSRLWLTDLVQLADVRPWAGLVGCLETGTAEQVLLHAGQSDVGYTVSLKPATQVTGAALMVRLKMVGLIGGFDEVYESYSEEDDLVWRARLAGFGVYQATVPIYHAQMGSFRRYPLRASFLSIRNRLRFALKHFGLIAIGRECARLAYLCCSPAVANRTAAEIPLRRMRYSRSPIVNGVIYLAALAWNAWALPSTIHSRCRDRRRAMEAASALRREIQTS